MAIANQQAKTDELRNMEASIKSSMDEATGQLKEELQEKISRIKELESELILTETQFARAVAESEVRISCIVKVIMELSFITNNNLSICLCDDIGLVIKSCCQRQRYVRINEVYQ